MLAARFEVPGESDSQAVAERVLELVNDARKQFREMGVAFVVAPQSDLRILWAQVFAAPR